MPRASDELAADGGPVVGEPVMVEAVQPSEAAIEVDRENRKSRTNAQTFSAAAVVTVLVWLLRLSGADLNPLADQEEIPAEVASAMTAVLTALAALRMNRRR